VSDPVPPRAVTTTTAVVRSARRRRVLARVWYPELPIPEPVPALAFGHGHLAPAGAYASLLARVAAAGFVVVAPDSERTVFPNHAAFAEDLWRSLRWLAAGAPGVPALADSVDPRRLGVAGHSMGGGCALLAAARHPRIATVATLAAARTRPSALEASAALRVPVLFLAAERDTVAPLAIHQRPLFQAVRVGTPAQLRVIRGATHAGFLNPVGPWGVRTRPGRMSRRDQIALGGEVLASWLNLTLGGRAEEWDAVWGSTASKRDDLTIETRSPPRRA
jgi:dienelactone hydrolase